MDEHTNVLSDYLEVKCQDFDVYLLRQDYCNAGSDIVGYGAWHV